MIVVIAVTDDVNRVINVASSIDEAAEMVADDLSRRPRADRYEFHQQFFDGWHVV